MSDQPREERPVLPDDWVELEFSDPDPDAVKEEIQRRHKLSKPVDSGVDEERGPFDVIPLSMMLGGKATPREVFKKPMKHLILEEQSIPPRGWYKSKIEADRVRPRPCLLPDAKVNTPDGLREIQYLKVGDTVWGYDDGLGQVVRTTVMDSINHVKYGYLELDLTNGAKLRLTPEHLVYSDNKGWSEAESINVGEDNLLSMAGLFEIQLRTINVVDEEALVYDIQTGTHNFFAEGVLVHNCYTEALLTSPYLGFCPVGCSFSLIGGTMVMTQYGEKAIEDFRVGDWVLGKFNREDVSEVIATTHHKSYGYYHVKLSNGREWGITAGHLVWVVGTGWVDIEELYDNYENVKLEELRPLRHSSSQINEEILRLVPEVTSQGAVGAYATCECGCNTLGGDQSQIAWAESSQSLEQGQEIFRRNQAENVGGIETQTCQPSQRQAQVIGMEAAAGRQTCCREGGLSNQQANALHEQVRTDVQMPVGVGIPGGRIFGPDRLELEVREREDNIGRGRVSARFLHIQPGLESIGRGGGSEGLLPGRPTTAHGALPQAFEETGSGAGGLASIEIEGIGYITNQVQIVSMEYVEGEVDVYDIQTTSENFYASGVLVHNCYINNGSRGYRATGLPTVNPNYPEQYHKQLKKMRVAGAGYMTSFSEAFHKLEDTYHVTERLTNVFVEEGLPIFYCTRRLPMEFAVEALQINPYSYCQFSINTSNPDDYRKLSPGAAKLDEMFKMIERLHNLGVYISIQCNPIHPGITTLDDLKELVRILASVGTDHIIFKFVEQVMNSRKVIVDRLYDRRFPDEKVDLFDKLFNQVIGGVYTIQQDLRIEWLEELLATTRQHGMTQSTCYEYYENGKAGANLAPYFTTSDQCHGRGVPIHYRPTPEAKFIPLPGCYRKGCLYCADYGTKACRSETLQQAKALEYKDLCNTIIEGRDEDWDVVDSCARPEDEPMNMNANPGYMTDAELWGWIPRYTPEAEIGGHVPALEQHSGSRDVIDLLETESIS